MVQTFPRLTDVFRRLVLLSLACSTLHLWGQQVMPFRSLTSRDGLNQNSVLAVTQDRQGFIWLGTQDGLHRYDGYELVLYRNKPDDPGSLSANLITAIQEDGEGRLWVGTYSDGLNRRKPDMTFERFLNRPGEPRMLTSNNINMLTRLRNGNAVAGTQAGLNIWQPDKERFSLFVHQGDWDWINAVLEMRDGRIYLGTQAGLALFENEVFNTTPLLGGSSLNQVVRCLFEDPDGSLWVGTENGLYLFGSDRDLQNHWQHDPDRSDSLPHNTVTGVTFDAQGVLWVSTLGGGVAMKPPGAKGFHTFDENTAGRIDNRVFTLFQDRGGVLWFGTSMNGATRLARGSGSFDLWRPGSGSAGVSTRFNIIRGITEDQKGRIWLGTEGGLVVMDRAGSETRYITSQNTEDMPEGVIWSVAADGERLWIGSAGGLGRLNMNTGNIKRFPDQDDEVTNVRALLPDDEQVWAGCFGSGLYRLDRSGRILNRYRRQPTEPASLPSNRVLALGDEGGGNLLVGTIEGMVRLSGATGRTRRFVPGQLLDAELSSPIIRTIYRAHNGDLWVGTNQGLNRLTPDGGGYRVRVFLEEDGLPNNAVYGVLEDDKGNFWLSTNKGLARFHPRERTFRSFGINRGLQDFEFNANVALAGSNGELFFGGVRGLNSFRPGALRESNYRPDVFITDITRNTESIPLHDHGAGPLVMENDHRVLSIRFACSDFSAPERNRFTYQLEGFDKDWVDLPPARQNATYTNLDPGNYTFRVRASSPSGNGSETPAVLNIHVRPPVWQSPLAYGFYAILAVIALILLSLSRRKRKHLHDQAHLRLKESEERLKWALWGSGDGLWDWQIEKGQIHRTLLWEMLDYNDQAVDGPLHFQNDLLHPEDLPRMQSLIEDHLAGRTPFYEAEYRIRARDGNWKWILDRGKVIERDNSGNPIRVAGTHKEITLRKSAEEKLRLAARVMESTNDAVFITDLDFNMLQVNTRFHELTGFSEEQVQFMSLQHLFADQYGDGYFKRQRERLFSSTRWEDEVWLTSRGGDRFLAGFFLSLVLDEDGEPNNCVGVFADITQRKKAEEDLRYLANYDALTGLPNRTLFSERLERAMIRADRNKQKLALLFTDLDRFKQINDSLGHNVGDLLLQEVSSRLSSCVRQEDTVARLGGDEFLIILEEVSEMNDVRVATRKVLAQFARPFHLDGHEVIISQSIGISIYPDDGKDIRVLLKNADTAMYHAKERGRNNFQFYAGEMNATSLRRLEMESLLRRALDQGELSLVYQPKIDIASGKIIGAEALLRW
nr:diguanylate cyclase [Acidobacteriota bacterium]